MLLEIGLELRPQHVRRPFLADVVGIVQAGDGLATQVPQEPLLGDALGDPAHDRGPNPREPSLVCRLRQHTGPPEAAFAFGLREHLAKPRAQSAEEPARPRDQPAEDAARLVIAGVPGRIGVGIGLVRNLTIELVTVGADGNQVHIHY